MTRPQVEITDEVVEADRRKSEAILARAHTTAIGALVGYIAEILITALGYARHSDTKPIDKVSSVLQAFHAFGAVTALLGSAIMIAAALVTLWPVACSKNAKTEAQYSEHLLLEQVGPSITEARELHNRAMSRAWVAKLTLIMLFVSLTGASLFAGTM